MSTITRQAAILLALALVVVACAGDPAPATPDVATHRATPVAVVPTPIAPSAPAATATASPTPTQTPTPSPSPTATPAQTPTPSPTPTATPTPTPTASPTPGIPAGMTLLGRWKTKFTPGVANGDGANINVPAKRINETIVRPGQGFNFIRAVLPITEPPYHVGGVLRNGQIIEDGVLGGGMCSASTTLFNAAMRAGLTITERHAHALYISRYPVGLDATILGTAERGQNMLFVNDTANNVMIRGIPGRRRVIFEIWGVDDGRTVHLSHPRIEKVREAEMYMEYSDELEPGETKRKHDNYDAFESWVTRTVRDRNGRVIHENTWHSKYQVLNGLTEVGRYPNDPPAGTRILAADYPGPPPE